MGKWQSNGSGYSPNEELLRGQLVVFRAGNMIRAVGLLKMVPAATRGNTTLAVVWKTLRSYDSKTVKRSVNLWEWRKFEAFTVEAYDPHDWDQIMWIKDRDAIMPEPSALRAGPPELADDAVAHTPLVHELAELLAAANGTPWAYQRGAAGNVDPHYRDAEAIIPIIERESASRVARANENIREAIARVESDGATGGLIRYGLVLDTVRTAIGRPSAPRAGHAPVDIDALPLGSIITNGNAVAIRKFHGWSVTGQAFEYTSERLLEVLETVHFTVLRVGREI